MLSIGSRLYVVLLANVFAVVIYALLGVPILIVGVKNAINDRQPASSYLQSTGCSRYVGGYCREYGSTTIGIGAVGPSTTFILEIAFGGGFVILAVVSLVCVVRTRNSRGTARASVVAESTRTW